MTTPFDAVAEVVIARFNANFAPPGHTVTLVHENDTRADPGPREKWMRVSVREADSRHATIRGNQNGYRHVGVVTCQIFVPLKDTVNSAREIADHVVSFMRAVVDTGVRFRVPRANPVGPGDTHYQFNVDTPYQYDEVA